MLSGVSSSTLPSTCATMASPVPLVSARANRRRLGGEAKRRDRGLNIDNVAVAYAGDEEVLPDGEPDIPIAEGVGDLGKPAHLRGRHLAAWQHDADPVEAGLLLRVNTN